jgi:hypothetical protein
MAVTIGGADGGSKFTKKKQFKIKDGDNTYRILPSLGFNGKKPNGKWSKFYNVHFGYKNSEGKMRVFQSSLVKNQKTKMIEQPDAALERIEKLKAELEKAKAAGNKAMVERLGTLVSGQKPMYNMDNNHHMNVINEQGEIGILKLRHRGKLALDAVIKTLRAEGVEPLGAETGRFFIINRQGSGLETTFTVRVKTQKVTIDGRSFNEEVVHTITPEIINRLEAEAGDLDELYVRPTSEEVARIVAESDLLTGKSRAIDELFDTRNQAAAATSESSEEEGDTDDGGPSLDATRAQATASQPTSQPTQSLSQTPPKAAASVQLDTTPPPAAKAAPAALTTEMSDEDFLKSLG